MRLLSPYISASRDKPEVGFDVEGLVTIKGGIGVGSFLVSKDNNSS